MKYLFGPVPSRRLGISLGVDLIPHKFCSLNCVYCEIGRTNNLTIERKEYIPISEIIAELDEYLSKKPELDYITFSGQGEPTLNSGIGKVITFIKEKYPLYKVAVITNGTLFNDEQVRKDMFGADLILPSLDAATQLTYYKVNRPQKSLKVEEIIDGLVQLKKEFTGKMDLEIFFVPGLNDNHEDLVALRNAIMRINPDIVQLNSLDRPGTEDWVEVITEEKMQEIVDFFQPQKCEIIAKFKSKKNIKSFDKNIEQQIVSTLSRRPLTDIELTEVLNIHINELNKYLSQLVKDKKIIPDRRERGIFFKIRENINE